MAQIVRVLPCFFWFVLTSHHPYLLNSISFHFIANIILRACSHIQAKIKLSPRIAPLSYNAFIYVMN